jgi:alkyldihydroxyacetonephosphate synthase
MPDWIALRHGRIGQFPDGISYPTSDEEIRSLFNYAGECEAHVIPFGGGTSVVGHINPLAGDAPTLTLDLGRLNHLIDLDETSRLATIEAGANGPIIEEQLNRQGFTLGHYPQSFELSTLGGWIATRSSGQQSYYYGRIEDLFAGGHVETPLGALELAPVPASAAGPDLRQMVLGSEGRLGVITRATVRVRPMPGEERFYGIFFGSWGEGVQAMREIAQSRAPISMARLSNALETETTLELSGKQRLVEWARRGLSLARYGPERCLLILGVTGSQAEARQARGQALDLTRKHGGLYTGTFAGNQWRKSRFRAPYLRNTLWERGYAVDTLETALPWRLVPETCESVLISLESGLASKGEKVMAFAHLSHIYGDGASIYVTYLFRRSEDPDETLENWRCLKDAASRVIIERKGTISHQHGVGVDHASYLEIEKGPLGIAMLKNAARALDPNGMMNPGKLWH